MSKIIIKILHRSHFDFRNITLTSGVLVLTLVAVYLAKHSYSKSKHHTIVPPLPHRHCWYTHHLTYCGKLQLTTPLLPHRHRWYAHHHTFSGKLQLTMPPPLHRHHWYAHHHGHHHHRHRPHPCRHCRHCRREDASYHQPYSWEDASYHRPYPCPGYCFFFSGFPLLHRVVS